MEELEVLASIYSDSIVIKNDHEFFMCFLPYTADENDKAFLLVDMDFTLPSEYPRSPPAFKVLKQKALSSSSCYNRIQVFLYCVHCLGTILIY